MTPNTARVLRALFYAYVAASFLHIAYVVHHEPFAFDAWNVAVDTRAEPASVGRFFDFWHQQYTASNPRIGQEFAYLAYKVEGFAEVGTPLAFFAIVLAAFVLGAGRWPSRKANRDLATLAIGIGFLWFASPNLPAYMFCRAYATNYVWSIAIQMWFLVPLRLHARGQVKPTVAKLVAYGVLGVAAGMCNEHTGPTLLLFTFGYVVWARRKRLAATAIAYAGAAGALAGYAVIFFAPGQSQRYEGLGERYSLFQQILVRGFEKNFGIFIEFLGAAAPLMLSMFLMIAIGTRRSEGSEDDDATRQRQRDALGFVGLVLAAASLITITVFASPKLGQRFYMHGMAMLLAATLGIVLAFLRRAATLAPFVIVAVLASVYAGARTIPLYAKISQLADQRLSGLAATPAGGVYTAESWTPVDETWWSLGDDVRDQKKQQLIARFFALRRVLFRGGEQWKILGVSDAKTTWDYEFDEPISLDKIDELDIQPFIGRDIGGIQHAFLDAVAEIELATHQRPRWIDLKVGLHGPHPAMPRRTLYLARWKAGVLEGYTAQLGRTGRSKDRRIVPSEALKQTGWEIWLVLIGDEPRRIGTTRDELTYVPWATGEYWTLACNPGHCFVVMAVNHTI